jgi:hypothetical protein
VYVLIHVSPSGLLTVVRGLLRKIGRKEEELRGRGKSERREADGLGSNVQSGIPYLLAGGATINASLSVIYSASGRLPW